MIGNEKFNHKRLAYVMSSIFFEPGNDALFMCTNLMQRVFINEADDLVLTVSLYLTLRI